MAVTVGDICKIILAVILPPLGVFAEKERCDKDVLINILLTILGYIPGRGQLAQSISAIAEHCHDFSACALFRFCLTADSNTQPTNSVQGSSTPYILS